MECFIKTRKNEGKTVHNNESLTYKINNSFVPLESKFTEYCVFLSIIFKISETVITSFFSCL